MDMIKQYSGNIIKSSSSITICPYYGLTNTSWTIESFSTLFNLKLVEFLTECGVDAKYDGTYLWINGYPICFWVQTTFYNIGLAFNNSAVSTSSSTTAIFDNNGNYNFRVRLLGNPQTAFSLLVSGNVTSLAFNNTGSFRFIKGTNIMNNKQARLIGVLGNSPLYAIDLEADGTPINAGHASVPAPGTKLGSLADDFTNNENIIPLVESIVGIHKLTGCYMGLTNDSYPKPATAYADAQVFLKINGEIFYRDYNTGFIKCEQ